MFAQTANVVCADARFGSGQAARLLGDLPTFELAALSARGGREYLVAPVDITTIRLDRGQHYRPLSPASETRKSV